MSQAEFVKGFDDYSILELEHTVEEAINSTPGPDHWFAETPDEIACWIGTIRTAYKMLGSKYVRPADSEKSNRIEARRSVVALVDIAEGELLDSSNIGLRRPGDGLAPSLLGDIFGLTSVRTIKRGEKLALGDMSN